MFLNFHTVNHRNVFSALLVLGVIFFSTYSYADRESLPLAQNLQELGKQANQQNIPIALLFTAKGLKSTENLKNEAILPALYSGQLDGKVLMREIEVNTDASTVDFYGEKLANSEFKELYNLTSLPVVLFLNGDGDQLSDPLMSGAYDFYFFYLKDSINASLKHLGNPALIE